MLQGSNLTAPIPESHFKEKRTPGGTTKPLMPRLKITFSFFNKKPCFSSVPETSSFPASQISVWPEPLHGALSKKAINAICTSEEEVSFIVYQQMGINTRRNAGDQVESYTGPEINLPRKPVSQQETI